MLGDLFEGHPQMVIRFNQFLPPAYHLENTNSKTVVTHRPSLNDSFQDTLDAFGLAISFIKQQQVFYTLKFI